MPGRGRAVFGEAIKRGFGNDNVTGVARLYV
jgi:hypothetical protein